MALTLESLERSFQYNGLTLPDPDPRLSVEQVQAFHARQYPELGNAKPMVENTANGKEKRITFTVPAGTKG